MKKTSALYELLLLNSQTELKKWLIENGKSGKPICPVVFNINQVQENMSTDSRKDYEV